LWIAQTARLPTAVAPIIIRHTSILLKFYIKYIYILVLKIACLCQNIKICISNFRSKSYILNRYTINSFYHNKVSKWYTCRILVGNLIFNLYIDSVVFIPLFFIKGCITILLFASKSFCYFIYVFRLPNLAYNFFKVCSNFILFYFDYAELRYIS
jgi:hypothetical protein